MSEPVPGRSCEGCHMCCKVPPIEPLQKPGGVWCTNCEIGTGCLIYDTRPEPCRGFLCGYRVDASLSEAWKPSNAKFIFYADPRFARLVVMADPAAPNAWRKEPYYSQLKRWSETAAISNKIVTAFVGKRCWVITPEGDLDVGEIGDDEVLVSRMVMTATGRRREISKLKKSDRRLGGTIQT